MADREHPLVSLALRQSALAELGARALAEPGIDALLDAALTLAAQVLRADQAEALLADPSGRWLRLSAGRSGRSREEGSGGFSLRALRPVVFEDLATEPDTRRSKRLREQELRSGVSVPIPGRERPQGLLGVYSREPRRFGQDGGQGGQDAQFLHAVAQLVALALEQHDARRRLGDNERRFRALIEHASDAIALVDAEGRLLYASPYDVPGASRALDALTRSSEGSLVNESRVRHKDGSWVWIETVATNLLHEPAVAAIVSNYRDVTDRKEAEERILHQARHDPLTDLPNRALFMDRLAQALARALRGGRGVALVLCDLDHFKSINDNFGHQAGDHALEAVAARLRSAVRADDTVARLGGDEFTLVLEEVTGAEDACRVAEKVLAALAEPLLLDGQPVRLGASLGISLYPFDGVEVGTLLRHADNALYRAKERGRGGFQLCTPELNQRAFERLRLERSLAAALERDELRLHYQPELRAGDGKLVALEALLRWQHPEHGLLYPERFIPLAESSRLIEPIGDWVIEQACRQVKRWQQAGLRGLRVAVNLSGVQFGQQGLARRVERILGDVSPAPGSLEVEITESVAMRDEALAGRMLAALGDLSVGAAIDDFGTGHSSLAALHRFPVQTLKIDRSFVAGLDGAGALVRAIITMAHSLGLRVVAEGVETELQRLFLKREGCDALQGYLLGRPEPADAITRRLALPS